MEGCSKNFETESSEALGNALLSVSHEQDVIFDQGDYSEAAMTRVLKE